MRSKVWRFTQPEQELVSLKGLQDGRSSNIWPPAETETLALLQRRIHLLYAGPARRLYAAGALENSLGPYEARAP
jgi:hypothetical protein